MLKHLMAEREKILKWGGFLFQEPKEEDEGKNGSQANP